MQIIEVCPKCGHDLLDSVIDVMPPIYSKECLHCGWSCKGYPTPDSEAIASLLNNFEYRPEQREDILKKYDSLIEG